MTAHAHAAPLSASGRGHGRREEPLGRRRAEKMRKNQKEEESG